MPATVFNGIDVLAIEIFDTALNQVQDYSVITWK
jgi:hypothetical protein